ARRLARAVESLLRRVSADSDGFVAVGGRGASGLTTRRAAPGTTLKSKNSQAHTGRGRDPGNSRAGAAPTDSRPGWARHAVDRRMGARRSPGSDSAVLPDRLHRRRARARHRAARRARAARGVRLRAVVHAHPARGAWRADRAHGADGWRADPG